MKTIDIIATVLLVVGGANWGLWGLLQFDLVAALLGGNTALLSKVVYTVVGLAALYQIVSFKGILKRWQLSPVMA